MEDRSGYVYLVEGDGGRFYKIGRTNNVPTRMKAFARMRLPITLKLIHYIPTLDAEAAERLLHQQFKPERINGEWFALTPADVEWLKGLESRLLDWDAYSYTRGWISMQHESVPLSISDEPMEVTRAFIQRLNKAYPLPRHILAIREWQERGAPPDEIPY